MLRLTHPLLVVTLFAAAACHPGPVLTPKADVGGTIAGIVSTEGDAPVPGRKVTAVEVATGMRYEATTGTNGGYTIKVPQGTYRLELELRSSEVVVKQPPETKIQKSDLDPRRDFTISAKPPTR
jgi:Carboxypeptidase regulatory-like domain